MPRGWIGVDLDGTLMVWQGNDTTMGAPIPFMVNRVKQWLAKGEEVRIFTSRASHEDPELLIEVIHNIEDFCVTHIGQVLKITCKKEFGCKEYWDDKAIRVIKNTGMTEKEYTTRRRAR